MARTDTSFVLRRLALVVVTIFAVLAARLHARSNDAVCRIDDVTRSGESVVNAHAGQATGGMRHGDVIHASVFLSPGPFTEAFLLIADCGTIASAISLPALLTSEYGLLPIQHLGEPDASGRSVNTGGSAVRIPAKQMRPVAPGRKQMWAKVAFVLPAGQACEDGVTMPSFIVREELVKPESASQTLPKACAMQWKPLQFVVPPSSMALGRVVSSPLVNRTEPDLNTVGLYGQRVTIKLNAGRSATALPARIQVGAFNLPLSVDSRPTTTSTAKTPPVTYSIILPLKPRFTQHLVCKQLTHAQAFVALALMQPTVDSSFAVSVALPLMSTQQLTEAMCSARPLGAPLEWASLDILRPQALLLMPGSIHISEIRVNDDRNLAFNATGHPTGRAGNVMRLERGRSNLVEVLVSGYGPFDLRPKAVLQLFMADRFPANITVRAGPLPDKFASPTRKSVTISRHSFIVDVPSTAPARSAAAAVNPATDLRASVAAWIATTMIRVTTPLGVELAAPTVHMLAQADINGAYSATLVIRTALGVNLTNLHLSISHNIASDAVDWGSLEISQSIGYAKIPASKQATRLRSVRKSMVWLDAIDLTKECLADNEWRVMHCNVAPWRPMDAKKVLGSDASEARDQETALRVSLAVPPYFKRPIALKLVVTADNVGPPPVRLTLDVGPGVPAEMRAADPAALGVATVVPFLDASIALGTTTRARTAIQEGAADAAPRASGGSESDAYDEDDEDAAAFDTPDEEPPQTQPDHTAATGTPQQQQQQPTEQSTSDTSDEPFAPSVKGAAAHHENIRGFSGEDASRTSQALPPRPMPSAQPIPAPLSGSSVVSPITIWLETLAEAVNELIDPLPMVTKLVVSLLALQSLSSLVAVGQYYRAVRAGSMPSRTRSQLAERLRSGRPARAERRSGSRDKGTSLNVLRTFSSLHSWLGAVMPCSSVCRSVHIAMFLMQSQVMVQVITLIWAPQVGTADTPNWLVLHIAPLMSAFCFRRMTDRFFHNAGVIKANLSGLAGSLALGCATLLLNELISDRSLTARVTPDPYDPYYRYYSTVEVDGLDQFDDTLWRAVYPTLQSVCVVDFFVVQTLFAAAGTIAEITSSM
jgi:hypothetical protein